MSLFFEQLWCRIWRGHCWRIVERRHPDTVMRVIDCWFCGKTTPWYLP